MVLPEDLCSRLAALAENESRTLSNMAKVLIQDGVKRYEKKVASIGSDADPLVVTEDFRSVLEAQQPRRLRGAPRRFRLHRPS